MTVAGLAKNSLADFPGLVSCVLFVPGCNYDCFYCHNRGLLDGTQPALNMETVEAFLRKRAGILDGAVVTGGEPTLQKGLLPFLAHLKELGYKVKLDTNGSSPETVEQVLRQGLCDYFAVDYKAPAEKYPLYCRGVADARTVLQTIHLLLSAGASFEVRTTVFPQLTAENLKTMARELPAVPRYVLNRYRKPERVLPGDLALAEATPYTQERIAAFAEELRSIQPNITA